MWMVYWIIDTCESLFQMKFSVNVLRLVYLTMEVILQHVQAYIDIQLLILEAYLTYKTPLYIFCLLKTTGLTLQWPSCNDIYFKLSKEHLLLCLQRKSIEKRARNDQNHIEYKYIQYFSAPTMPRKIYLNFISRYCCFIVPSLSC